MWTCNADGVFESDLLKQFPWLWHGFGSRLSGAWPGEYTSVKQIHSDIVQVADGGGRLGEGDALVTSTPGLRVGVRTADCVPILLADPHKRVVAAVHAGWRGTLGEIARRTVERMQRDFSCDPSEIRAAVGPCIAECCFEVGPEVAVQFGKDGGISSHVDLVAANVRQFAASGLVLKRVDVAGLCTACDAATFHSFRRDKQASGRMVAAIAIVDG